MSKLYDIIIIGAGPAGFTAGLYAGRARMSTLIIERAADGGQITSTSEIENYPGSLETESGVSLMQRFAAQAEKFGAEKIYDDVIKVDLIGNIKTITCTSGVYQSKAVIIATGAHPSHIGCPGETEFTGRGVSYCATCDGAFFEDLDVYVVGGGDAAVEEAMYLTRYARKVTVIHRRDELRAAKSIQEKAFKTPKLEFMWNTTVEEILGDSAVNCMVLKDTKTDETRLVYPNGDDKMFGVFVFIGFKPNTALFEGQIEMEKGYIKTNADMHTNLPGVYAAGDCIVKSLRQVVTAAADGAIAAVEAAKYIEG